MQILYSLIISVFFGGLFYYLTNNVLIPYDSEGMLDVNNLTIVSSILILTVTSFFTFLHLLVDKLFFRKFYENPRIFLAIRRGVLLGILLVSLAWIRIFDFWQWNIILLVASLPVLFEALFISVGRGRGKKSDVSKVFERGEEGKKQLK